MIRIRTEGESLTLGAGDAEQVRLLARPYLPTPPDPEAESPAIWIDLVNPSTEEEELVLNEVFGLHPLVIEDCRAERLHPEHGDHLPKVEDYNLYLFSIINPVEFEEGNGGRRGPTEHRTLLTRQVNVVLGENFIITHHYEPSRAIDSIFSSCGRNTHYLQRGPDFIYHLVLDEIIDDYTPLLDSIDKRVNELEEVVFNSTGRISLQRILRLKRQVFQIRRITVLQREMIYRLSRGEFALINEREIAYYRNVYDHIVRTAELVESYRETLTSLVEAQLSMASNRLNEVMKVLAIISTFFLPLTFIAGVYGMNFDPDASPWNMPELRWVWGYPFSLGLMAAVAVVMFIWFRRRRWL